MVIRDFEMKNGMIHLCKKQQAHQNRKTTQIITMI